MPLDCCWFAVIALRPHWGSVQCPATRDQISSADVSQSQRRDQIDVCLWVYDSTEQKKLTLIRSRTCTTSKHAHRVSQQDTELSAKESCPAGAVQDTHCSGCCCCGAVGILERERWTVYHRWRLAGCSAFLPAERSQSVIFPRSYCYGSVLAPVIAEYRWLRGAHQAAANQRRELEQCCRVSHRQIQRKERVPNAYVIFCTYETYVRNAYGKITYAFARTLSATAQQHGATERDVASLMCTYIV